MIIYGPPLFSVITLSFMFKLYKPVAINVYFFSLHENNQHVCVKLLVSWFGFAMCYAINKRLIHSLSLLYHHHIKFSTTYTIIETFLLRFEFWFHLHQIDSMYTIFIHHHALFISYFLFPEHSVVLDHLCTSFCKTQINIAPRVRCNYIATTTLTH